MDGERPMNGGGRIPVAPKEIGPEDMAEVLDFNADDEDDFDFLDDSSDEEMIPQFVPYQAVQFLAEIAEEQQIVQVDAAAEQQIVQVVAADEQDNVDVNAADEQENVDVDAAEEQENVGVDAADEQHIEQVDAPENQDNVEVNAVEKQENIDIPGHTDDKPTDDKDEEKATHSNDEVPGYLPEEIHDCVAGADVQPSYEASPNAPMVVAEIEDGSESDESEENYSDDQKMVGQFENQECVPIENQLDKEQRDRYREINRGSSSCTGQDQNDGGGIYRRSPGSDEDAIEEQVREDILTDCEEAMERLEVQAQPDIQAPQIEGNVQACGEAENEHDELNGVLVSGEPPEDQQEKVIQMVSNAEAALVPEPAQEQMEEDIEEYPDADVVPDEQDNLVEEIVLEEQAPLEDEPADSQEAGNDIILQDESAGAVGEPDSNVKEDGDAEIPFDPFIHMA